MTGYKIGKGRHFYTFENICIQDKSILLEDEAYKIFVNLNGTVQDADKGTLELLRYIADSTDETIKDIDNPLVKKIHERISHIRVNEAMGGELMTLMMRDAENRAEGREEGIRVEREKNAKTMVETLKELGVKEEIICEKLRKNLNFSDGEIKRFLNQES